MDRETRLNRNSLEYWIDLPPKVIARDYGYMLSKSFVEALDEFINGLNQRENKRRSATNGEKGILTMALGVLGEAHLNGIKPPLEKRRKRKEKNKEERKKERKKERGKKRKKRKNKRNKKTSFS